MSTAALEVRQEMEATEEFDPDEYRELCEEQLVAVRKQWQEYLNREGAKSKNPSA
jgi:hypothetical protein